MSFNIILSQPNKFNVTSFNPRTSGLVIVRFALILLEGHDWLLGGRISQQTHDFLPMTVPPCCQNNTQSQIITDFTHQFNPFCMFLSQALSEISEIYILTPLNFKDKNSVDNIYYCYS